MRVAQFWERPTNTVKDQMENTTERSVRTVSDPQRSSKTGSLRVAEIETSSVPATLKDPQRSQKTDKDSANPATLSDP